MVGIFENVKVSSTFMYYLLNLEHIEVNGNHNHNESSANSHKVRAKSQDLATLLLC